MEECRRMKIIKDITSSLSMTHKIIIYISSALFIVSTVVSIPLQFIPSVTFNNYSIFIVATFEVIFIISFLKGKDKYVLSKYSKIEIENSTPEKYGYQSVRYLKFRSKLKEANINSDKIDGLLQILKVREQLEAKKGYYSKKFGSFLVAIFIALVVSFIKSYDFNQMIFPALIGIVLSIFAYIIASIIPSPIEKIYELRYFLTIYQKEKMKILYNNPLNSDCGNSPATG